MTAIAELMVGVREYCEEEPVKLQRDNRENSRYWKGSARWVIKAYNEGGYNSTEVDVLDFIAWLRAHRPDLLEAALPEESL